MDKNTNLTNPAVTAVTRVDAVGAVKKPGGAPTSAAGQPPPLPNFAVLARRILGNWPIIVIVTIIGVPVAIKVSHTKKPSYKSEGVIVFRGGVNGDPSMEMMKSVGNRVKEIAVAQSTLKRVIDELKLSPQATAQGQYDGLIAAMRPKIDAKPKGSDSFTITYDASTPDEAQQVTQRLCEVIIEEGTKSRQDRAKDSIDFLESEKKRADDDLEKSEKARTLFMSDHPEFAIDSKGGATIRAEQKAGVTQRKNAAGNAARVRRASGVPDRGGPAPASGSAPGGDGPAVDPVLVATRTQARSELAAAKKALAEKSLNFTDQHPDVRAAAARVAAAEAALAQAEAAIASAQREAPAPAPAPTGAAPTGADPYDDPATAPTAPRPVVAGGAPPAETAKPKPVLTDKGEPIAVEIEADWSRINREIGEARARRSQLEGRLFQAEITANSEVSGYGSQLVMTDPASRASAPTGMNPQLLRAAGVIVAVALGFVLAAIRGILLDDRLFDASEVEALGLVPLLGSVPKVKTEKQKKSWFGRLRG